MVTTLGFCEDHRMDRTVAIEQWACVLVPGCPSWLRLLSLNQLQRSTLTAFSLFTWAAHGPSHCASLRCLPPSLPGGSSPGTGCSHPTVQHTGGTLGNGAACLELPCPAPRQRETPVWGQVSWFVWLLDLTLPILEVRLTIMAVPNSPGFCVGPGQGSGEKWNWGPGAT